MRRQSATYDCQARGDDPAVQRKACCTVLLISRVLDTGDLMEPGHAKVNQGVVLWHNAGVCLVVHKQATIGRRVISVQKVKNGSPLASKRAAGAVLVFVWG